MSFEVASVRPDDGPFRPPSFALSADEWFRDPAGRFHADFTVRTYIEFAYKTWLTPGEESAMIETLPAWASRSALQHARTQQDRPKDERKQRLPLAAAGFGMRCLPRADGRGRLLR
jgi:hypothetical protein